MCQTLGVSRGGYHSYLKLRSGQRALENKILIELIRTVWENSKRLYGSPRVHAELKAMGLRINRKRVERLMRENGLMAKTKRKFKVTTKSKHNYPVCKNLISQNFSTARPNSLWASDITYVRTQEGWLYLAVVMDLYSRMVVGWAMSNHIKESLVLSAINQAFINRDPTESLIFHSDRGSQYCSKAVIQTFFNRNIKQSMSGKGNCYDNAVVESFFHSLKTELIQFKNYQSRAEARSDIFEYIEIFYNRVRRHSTLGYLSPLDYENKSIKFVA